MPITIRNVAFYRNKGYDCHPLETIEVAIEDVNSGGATKENRICDFGGKEYVRPHHKHISTFNRFGKDVCYDCFKTNKEVKSIVQIKRENTCLEKYGEKNCMFIPEMVDKISQVMMEKYGVRNAN